jgi:hypothetical protein
MESLVGKNPLRESRRITRRVPILRLEPAFVQFWLLASAARLRDLVGNPLLAEILFGQELVVRGAEDSTVSRRGLPSERPGLLVVKLQKLTTRAPLALG